MVRLVEGDDRVAAAVRTVLHGVKARTYACLGEADACRRQVELAETALTDARLDEPGWVGRLADPAKLYAITGHALADLSERPGQVGHRQEAARRLTRAVDEFDSTAHARAYALCVTRAVTLQVLNGEMDDDEWASWVEEKLPPGQAVRSGRLGPVAEAVEVEKLEGGD